jgi:hypothetical protein
VNVAILRYFDHSGGQSFWSSANPLLARCLATKYAGREILAMDWGISRSVEFLTAGRTHMSDGFEYHRRLRPTTRRAVWRCWSAIRSSCSTPRGRPAFHGNREVLATVAATAGKRLVEEEVFCERDGRPNAIVVRACPREGDCGDLQRCPGSCGSP